MLKIIKTSLVIFTILWVSGCAQTTVRQHQDFEEIAKTIDTVVIVPADVEIELVNFDGDNEILEEKSEIIKKEIHALAKSKLTLEHLTVIDFDFAKASAEDEEFAYAITQAKEAWSKAKEELYEKGLVDEKKKSEFKTNLGSVLNMIADKTGADAVLLMKYSGYEKSAGMITKDVAASVLIGVLTAGTVISIQPTEGSFIDVALVETASGKVIWANRKGSTSANASPAEIAFGELPDLTWKNEVGKVLAEEANESPVIKEIATPSVKISPQAQ